MAAANLVTACKRCNSSRGTRSVRAFCRSVATYLNHGVAGEPRLSATSATRRGGKIDLAAARDLMKRRGGWKQALAA